MAASRKAIVRFIVGSRENWYSSFALLEFYTKAGRRSSARKTTAMPVSRTPPRLAELAYAAIRERVLDGSLPPGTPVSRRSLARWLGLSALPVGMAMDRLVAEGFLETRPRAGTRVRIPTAAEVRGNYVLREALETQAARLFAASASAAGRRRILRLAEQLDARYAALQANPSAARSVAVEKAHVAFHLAIARSTRCPQLVDAIERSRVLLFNWLFSRSAAFVALPPSWHADLARILVRSDPAVAAEAMRKHVQFRREEVVEHFRRLRRHAAGDGSVRRPKSLQTDGSADSSGLQGSRPRLHPGLPRPRPQPSEPTNSRNRRA
jgi:DNA-binding GntR family transcriptional regulator